MTKLTIIIPTKDRYAFLNRLLFYLGYFKLNYDFNIVISDSSSNLKMLKGNFVQKHFYQDYDFYHKIETTINTIKTPYVNVCADDDFVVIPNLFRAIDFMEENKDYAATQGHILGFTINKTFSYLLSKNEYSIEQDTDADRLQQATKKYYAVVYSLLRTKVAKTAFGYGNEINLFYSVVRQGKIKKLDFLTNARQKREDSDGAKSSKVKHYGYLSFPSMALRKLGYQPKYKELKEDMDRVLQIQDACDLSSVVFN